MSTSVVDAEARSNELWSGWRTLLGAAIGIGSGATLFVSVKGLFIKPLEAEFGWSRTEVSLSAGVGLLLGLMMPVLGALIDRFGSRVFILPGIALLSLAYVALAAMQGNVWIYYLILAYFGLIAGIASNSLIYSRIIVANFVASRGMALAIGACAPALVSVTLLPVLLFVIDGAGWRTAYLMMAAITIGLGGVAYALLAGRRAAGNAASQAAAGAPRAKLAELVGDPRFWLLLLAFVAATIPISGFGLHLQAYLSDQHFSVATAGLLTSLLAVSVILSRLFVGWLLDRYSPPLVSCLSIVIAAFGFALLVVVPPTEWVVALAVAAIAFGQGAETDIGGFLVARFFGVRAFGLMSGIVGLAFGVSATIGGVTAGFVFDQFGSYQPFHIAGVVLIFVSSAALLATGFVRPRESAPNAP